MSKIYLLLGSNIGNRSEQLQTARQHISDQIGEITSASSIYQTAAWGNNEQADFLNQALEVATELAPLELLKVAQQIEHDMGRQKTVKWGDRNIDIDILYYEDKHVKKPNLQIPHPEIKFRKFVLVPMAEIAEDFIHPVLEQNQKQLLDVCVDQSEVSIYELD